MIDAHNHKHMATLLAITLAAITLFLTIGPLHTSFLSDDIGLIYWGSRILHESPFQAFLGQGGQGMSDLDDRVFVARFYRPVTLLTHGLDKLVWGMNPAGHRFGNLMLHVACCLLLFLVIRQSLPKTSPWIAYVATVLFALHPIHELDLWWISIRMEMLCALFFISCISFFAAYLKHKRKRYLCLAALCCALSICSKEMGYGIPGVVLVYSFFRADPAPLKQRIYRATLPVLPIIGVTACFFTMRLIVFPAEGTLFALMVDAQHVMDVARLFVRRTIFPYHVSLREWVGAHPILIGAAALAVAGLAATQYRNLRQPAIWIAVLMSLAAMVPIIRAFSPWTMYIPSMALCTAMALALPVQRTRAGLCAAVLIAGLLLSYVVEWQVRKGAWDVADKAMRNTLAASKDALGSAPDQTPVYLSLPAAVDDIPMLMHYLPSFLDEYTDAKGTRPAVAAYLILPTDPDEHGVDVKQAEDGAWHIVPQSPRTRFTFPELPEHYYRVSGATDPISADLHWGSMRFEPHGGPDGRPRVIARFNEKYAAQIERQALYYSDGTVHVLGQE
jgi:hypothetical protein